jgi:hypothetical protein
MPTVVIRLADILTSASDPTDLTALSKDEAEAHVRRIYGFLREDAQVPVEDDVDVWASQERGRCGQVPEQDWAGRGARWTRCCSIWCWSGSSIAWDGRRSGSGLCSRGRWCSLHGSHRRPGPAATSIC